MYDGDENSSPAMRRNEMSAFSPMIQKTLDAITDPVERDAYIRGYFTAIQHYLEKIVHGSTQTKITLADESHPDKFTAGYGDCVAESLDHANKRRLE